MVFDDEDVELIRNLIKDEDKIDEMISDGSIAVDNFINEVDVMEIIMTHSYVVKVKNLLLCFEYDGYTIYVIKP